AWAASLGGDAHGDPVPMLRRIQERSAHEPPDRKRAYALQYAIDRFARGIESCAKRLRALGLTGMWNVLDVGCGAGQWSIAMLRESHSVVGVDKGPEFVEIATAV